MTEIPTRRIPYDLSETFTKRVPYNVKSLLIDRFTGDPTKTFIQFGPNKPLTRQEIRHNKDWEWSEEQELYIVNIQAQASAELIIAISAAGSKVRSGTPISNLSNATGALVNPATEDKQDDIITNTADKRPTTPAIYNVTMASADTEYSQALPTGTKRFAIHLQDWTVFRLAFVTGKVATPTAPYLSIPASGEHYQEGINVSSLTLYFASDVASKTAEIEVWT